MSDIFDHRQGDYFGDIYYEILGEQDKPVLLFLHGGFGNIEDFNQLTPQFLRDYRIIGIDSRGHGKSYLNGQLSYDVLQRDIEALLNHLGINVVSIIGFSDGGIVGYRLAAQSPIEVTQLVTMGSSWHIKNTEHLTEFFQSLTGDIWREKFPAHFDAYQQQNPEPDFDGLALQLGAMWLDAGVTGHPNDIVNQINCPMLVMRGENDPLVSEADLLALADIVKGTKVINLSSAGHEVYKDQTERVQRELQAFLAP